MTIFAEWRKALNPPTVSSDIYKGEAKKITSVEVFYAGVVN